MTLEIKPVADRILEGGAITLPEAQQLIAFETWPQVLELAAHATRIRERFTGNEVDLCSLVNAKSGNCPEDCKYCAQSSHWNTDIPTYPLMDPDQMVERAKQAKAFGAKRFCIVTATRGLADKDLPVVCETIRRVKEEAGIIPECSMGFLKKEQLLALKEAGMTRYNHNLETAESHFPEVCTAHTYQDRLNTIRMLKANGVEACCGGILGVGESRQERLDLAFALAELDVECAPINVLNARPGTPLSGNQAPTPLEVIKTIAVFRFILPRTRLELGGGREVNLRDFQVMAFLAGANSLIIGGYLTTNGRQPDQDLQMLKDLGFAI
ncbi:MAG: biotin synthase BioB [Candidatus Omnitrophica bacterium]|nr:biotin synthase BioB [Candidatus Omnitrophota bacterium]